MNILIDGHPTEIDTSGQDLEGVVKSILKVCADDGRVVTEIQVNGQPIPEYEGPLLQGVDPGDVETCVVQTDTIQAVAHNILKSSAESIPQLIDEFSLINQDLQSRNLESGLKRTEAAINFWISILEGCLKSIQILKVDLGEIEVSISEEGGDSTLKGNEVLQRINTILTDTQTAFENQDNLEIGDIFEYDLPPLLRSFQQVLFKVVDPA